MDSSPKFCQILSELLLQYYTTKSRMKLVSRSPLYRQQNCFGTQKKPFHQTLKGVQYESSTQKCRCLDTTHGKRNPFPVKPEDNDDDDDDNEGEGAFTRIKPLKACKK